MSPTFPNITFEDFRRYQNWIRETADIKIDSPETVKLWAIPHIKDYQKEYFILIGPHTTNEVKICEVVSIGSLNASIVHPREVYKSLIRNTCAHWIGVHNHPSGDPTPSREDIEITKKLKEAGDIVGIDMLDHVIIGKERYFSMKEAGHL